MLWMAVLMLATPGETAAPCPAPVIAFAPPLGTPLVLRRRIERALSGGLFVHETLYRLTFTQAGRGYRAAWQQTDEHSEGPAELLRLLALQEGGVAGESFELSLDASGAVLGISESVASTERLAEAIDRLRADPALAARPAEQRAQIMAMLTRLAMLPPEERIAMQRPRLERPVMLAGRPCRSGHVMVGDGAGYRIVRESGDSLELTASQQMAREGGGSIAVTDAVTLSRATGLLLSFDRKTVITVATTVRESRETWSLEAGADGF